MEGGRDGLMDRGIDGWRDDGGKDAGPQAPPTSLQGVSWSSGRFDPQLDQV